MLRALLSSLLALVAAASGVAAPAAVAQQAVDYVALGDSYASGTGTRSYYPGSGSCLRSPFAYPVLWIRSHSTSSFFFDACSGATTDDLLAGQLGNLGPGTDLVTVSIGGNDAGFAQVMSTCQVRGPAACEVAITAAEAYIGSELPARLDATYQAIRDGASAARVVVMGYPQLFEVGPCINSLTPATRARLNGVADQLAAVIADRASTAGFEFADSRAGFAGHRVCAVDEWINGPSFPARESYHPDQDGHANAYLPALDALTGSMS